MGELLGTVTKEGGGRGSNALLIGKRGERGPSNLDPDPIVAGPAGSTTEPELI